MNRWRFALGSLAFPVVFGALYFGAAGRVDLPPAWGVVAILTVFGLAMAAWGDRGMIAERMAPKGPNRDRVGQLIASVMLLVHWIVAGLDVRFAWSSVPHSMRWVGVGVYAVGVAILFWAVRVNPFYSSAVRLQSDRGQRPVDTGPYGVVRHPGYASQFLAALGAGLALGSWLAMIPLAIFIALFIRRLLNEDRMLHVELEGYAEYAKRVRYRLIPGVF